MDVIYKKKKKEIFKGWVKGLYLVYIYICGNYN